jgi:hypothetical protein
MPLRYQIIPSTKPLLFRTKFLNPNIMTNPIPPSAMASIQDALRRGQKIEAIKLYREHSGLGLKEAKDAVEALEKEMVPAAGSAAPTARADKGCLGLFMLLVILLVAGNWWFGR